MSNYFDTLSQSISDIYNSAEETAKSAFDSVNATISSAVNSVEKAADEAMTEMDALWARVKRSAESNTSINMRFTKEELKLVNEWHRSAEILAAPLLYAVTGFAIGVANLLAAPAALTFAATAMYLVTITAVSYLIGYGLAAMIREVELGSSVYIADAMERWKKFMVNKHGVIIDVAGA